MGVSAKGAHTPHRYPIAGRGVDQKFSIELNFPIGLIYFSFRRCKGFARSHQGQEAAFPNTNKPRRLY